MLNWYRALMRSILARRKVDIRVPASVPLLLIWGGTCRRAHTRARSPPRYP